MVAAVHIVRVQSAALVRTEEKTLFGVSGMNPDGGVIGGVAAMRHRHGLRFCLWRHRLLLSEKGLAS